MFFGKSQFTNRRRKNIFMGDGGSSNFDYGRSIYEELAEATDLSLGANLAVTGTTTVTGQLTATGNEQILGQLIGANFNVTTDQAIPIRRIGSQKYVITRIIVTNASVSLTTAVGGFYQTTSKGGTAIVANTQVYSSLTASTTVLNPTLAINRTYTLDNIYFSLTTAQGAAATGDIFVCGYVLP